MAGRKSGERKKLRTCEEDVVIVGVLRKQEGENHSVDEGSGLSC